MEEGELKDRKEERGSYGDGGGMPRVRKYEVSTLCTVQSGFYLKDCCPPAGRSDQGRDGGPTCTPPRLRTAANRHNHSYQLWPLVLCIT